MFSVSHKIQWGARDESLLSSDSTTKLTKTTSIFQRIKNLFQSFRSKPQEEVAAREAFEKQWKQIRPKSWFFLSHRERDTKALFANLKNWQKESDPRELLDRIRASTTILQSFASTTARGIIDLRPYKTLLSFSPDLRPFRNTAVTLQVGGTNITSFEGAHLPKGSLIANGDDQSFPPRK